MTSDYFILSLDREEYRSLRSNRKVSIPKHDKVPFEKGSILLIYLKEENKLIAEYDILNIQPGDTEMELELEPIYNAPTGLLVTDLVLLTLPKYGLKKWRKLLQSNVIPISEKNFEELITRLK